MPRDNVVLEAGYFAAFRGRERVLIVREEGAIMPADLSGIYVALRDREDPSSLDSRLRSFLEIAV